MRKNFRGNYLLLLCFLFSLFLVGPGLVYPARGAERPVLDEFRQQRHKGLEELEREHERGIEELKQAYEEFYKKRRRAFERFKQKLKQKWGAANLKLPDKKTWVDYGKDYKQRHGADFKAGQAYAAVIVDKETAEKEPGKVRDKLREEVEALVTDRGETDDIEEEIKKQEKQEEEEKPEPEPEEVVEEREPEKLDPEEPEQEPEDQEPLLSGQLETEEGEQVMAENSGEFAEEAIKSENVAKKEVVAEQGEEKVIVSVQLPLVSDHLQKRAKKYRETVQKYAREYKIPASLVFAIIHTESSFNPQARSPVPAYGLMQLVPKTGAMAAYRHVYGESRLLGPDYLYQPENNVELGTGYLQLLMSGYLNGIRSKQSRIYCAVAAYNTGAGNLAKTFVGSTDIQEAVKVINRLSPEEVYNELRSSLPYEETKDYVKRVRNRRPKYEPWEVVPGK